MLTILFACQTTKVLSLKNKQGYREYNILSKERFTELKQLVSYRTHVLDGNFNYALNFTILDSARLVSKKQLHFPADTTIVKPKFDIGSIWNWGDEPYTLKGDFILLNWTDSSVTIKEDIKVYDLRTKEHYIYKGKRTFTKKGK
ncbi:MAG: hypothetical protein V4643_08840 [Bacteroidota bacterium]